MADYGFNRRVTNGVFPRPFGANLGFHLALYTARFTLEGWLSKTNFKIENAYMVDLCS